MSAQGKDPEGHTLNEQIAAGNAWTGDGRSAPDPVLAFDEHGGLLLIAAKDVAVGDEVRFRASFANYVVEDVDTSPTGQVRHHHGNGTASSCYHPGELLWVDTPRKRHLGYLTKVARPEVPEQEGER